MLKNLHGMPSQQTQSPQNYDPVKTPRFQSIDALIVPQLRALNSSLFPFPYNDNFYAAVLNAPQYAFAAFINHQIIGAICCRIETHPVAPRIYIMTLGVLLLFRRRSIASTLLQLVIRQAHSDMLCSLIYLHVQTSNHAALNFYLRHGFVTHDTIPDYYPDLCPTSAYLLVYPLNASIPV